MEEVLVPIDKAGRVVLPKPVREELTIAAGDLLRVSVQGDQVILRPNRDKAGFTKRGGCLIFSTGGTDILENEVVESIRRSGRGRSICEIAGGLPSGKRK